MKILLVGTYPPDGQFSMEGFVRVLATGLSARGVDVRVIGPEVRLGSMPVPAGGRKWMGYLDKFLLFRGPLREAARWADVTHVCDQGNGMYLPQVRRSPHLLTCHDLLAMRGALGDLPDWPVGPTGKVYQKLILNGIRQANYVVCDSDATRQDLLRLVGTAPDRTETVYVGLLRPLTRLPEEESVALLRELKLDAEKPFLLHVGNNSIYKNRIGLLEIYRNLHRLLGAQTPNLVMAGRPLAPEMRRFVNEHKLEANVIECVLPSDLQVQALYSRALALCFPSLYEGFGLPIIEAQACGCPVFASNRAPLTEVGGKAAVYFDPTRPDAAAEILARDLPCTGPIAAAGLENVKRFSAEEMLERYIKVYEKVLQSAG